MTTPIVVPVVDEGLGNSAYLVDLGDGRALAVNASRDLRAVRTAAGLAGLRIAYAADTHLHTDSLAGAARTRELAQAQCGSLNRLLTLPDPTAVDEATFVTRLLGGLGSYPAGPQDRLRAPRRGTGPRPGR